MLPVQRTVPPGTPVTDHPPAGSCYVPDAAADLRRACQTLDAGLGGLVHPWLLYFAGVVLTWIGMSRQMMFGAPWGQATLEAGAEALRLAKSRRAAHTRRSRRG